MHTRITKLPEHDRVLLGRDLDEVFESGHVYGVRRILGEIMITDLGLSALNSTGLGDYPNKHSQIGDIAVSGRTYITQEEFDKEIG